MTSIASGYVYIASNPAYEGLLKIGVTTKQPLERMEQLSAASGVPGPFNLLHYVASSLCFQAETAIHQRLDYCRYSDSREFFTLALNEAISIVNEYSDVDLDPVETPYADLFASFAPRPDGDEYQDVLSPSEIAQCRALRDTLTPVPRPERWKAIRQGSYTVTW